MMAQPDELAGSAFTVDVFHRGGFHLVQPAGNGHRAGMDAMMLAAAVPSTFAGDIADLGAGAGAAGLAVLSRCPARHCLLVERASEMADCAERSLAHPGNNRLAGRASVLVTDVALTGKARRAAGLVDNSFDFVIMNPPFNRPGDRRSPDALREAAHVMEDGLFEKWLRTAAAILRPQGRLALIFRPQSLAEALAALQGRFGAVEIKPIHPRPNAAAIRVVIRAARGARRASQILPPLYLHEAEGNGFSAAADAINNGRGSLFGD